jgi:hypothetical protein
VKGILASYRWRRRIAWMTASTVAAAGVVALVVEWPNTTPKPVPPSNLRAHVDTKPLKPVKLKLHDKASSLKVVSKFVNTAVARKDIDQSWDLVAPEFRAGFTRKQWDSGEMPVVGFPVLEARWKLQYSDVEGVGYTIALLPTKASHQRAQVFMIGLHLIGAVHQRHWVVDNWQAAPTSGVQESLGTGGGGGAGNVLGASVTPPPGLNSSESAAWLLLPVGLLSLIVLVPLGIGTVNWYRVRRAERALLRS